MWKLIKTDNSLNSSQEQFFDAITIWIKKPQVIDRNLCGSSNIIFSSFDKDIFKRHFVDLHEFFVEFLKTNIDINSFDQFEDKIKTNLKLCEVSLSQNFENTIILRCVMPKDTTKYKYYEIVIYDVFNNIVTFLTFAKSLNDNFEIIHNLFHSYSFQYNQTRLDLFVYDEDSVDAVSTRSCSIHWLSQVLFLKIVNWARVESLNTNCTTLKMIKVDEYNHKYNMLKSKYGPYFVENWSEQTDPRKFVFEDIGIAAYLILIWEKKEWNILTRKYKFIDLGCGNGLLVYILSSEGYLGYGVDIRKRKIWELLNAKADLREEVFTPSDLNSCADVEWIIGNHSDELTPWIPVLAYKNTCNYFVIPCCFWDFFKRFSSTKGAPTKYLSNYEKYLAYLHQVGATCGFSVLQDVLRIPSTKNVCMIGLNRMDDEDIDESLEDLISAGKDFDWSQHFVPRPREEKMRNAVSLSQAVKERVWLKTYQFLLASSQNLIPTPDGRMWNCGGEIDLSLLSEVNKNDLEDLKSEDGGIQTLLRNCPNIFMIKGGKASIRNWFSKEFEYYKQTRRKKNSSKLSRDLRKTKICFHFQHHPQSCPFADASNCDFLHLELTNNDIFN